MDILLLLTRRLIPKMQKVTEPENFYVLFPAGAEVLILLQCTNLC
jgi:hypothetical protein